MAGLRLRSASGSFSPFASPDLISGDSAARSYVPSFTKYASNPIFQTVNLTTLTSMQWPWLLRVDDIFGAAGPYGESYRIYYSTDHETTTAGIGLLTATSLTGPWTDRGLVFRDAGGNQTETATVIYVPETQLFHMYYHQNSATGATSSQVTKLATMSLATAQAGPDSWTISTAVANGIVFDVPADGSSAWPPNGGWGYARPFRVGQKWYAHLLIAGTLNTYFALAYSRDGITWRQDARPLVYAANVCNDVGGRWNPSSHYVAWNSGTVFPWKGQLWWNGLMFSYIGGGGASTFTYDVVAPISADFRKLLGPPSPVFTSSQGWETSYTGAPGGLGDFRSGGSMIAGADGKLYKVYSGGTQGLGLAVGS